MSTPKRPTEAQKVWLNKLLRAPRNEIGFGGLPSYDMAGRMRDAGFIEIVDKPGWTGWPYTGWSILLTPAGREAATDKRGRRHG